MPRQVLITEHGDPETALRIVQALPSTETIQECRRIYSLTGPEWLDAARDHASTQRHLWILQAALAELS